MADEYDFRTLEIDSTGVKDPKVTRKFSDLDFDFVPHPVSKDILPLKDREAVKRSLRNLMFTDIDERPFSSGLGSGLRQLLFEPMNPMTQLSIELLIRDIIRLKERRVSVLTLNVSMQEDQNGYNVLLIFSIDNLSEIVTVNFFLERLR